MAARFMAILLFFVLSGSAQTDSVYFGRDTSAKPEMPRTRLRDQPWFDKMTFGGNFQAWFGNPSFIFLSPTVGYMPARNLNVGLGLVYNYTSVNFGSYGRFSQSIFGGHTFVRYILAESYFVQAQYDRLRQPDWFTPAGDDRLWVDYVLVGGGFRHQLGGKAALITSIMYNLTPHPFSIYPGRVIIQFGFVTSF